MAKKKLTLEEKMEEAIVTDVPYEVPGNWVCSKLGSLLKNMTTKKPDDRNEFFKYIDIDAIDNKNQRIAEPKVVNVKEAPSRASREVMEGDVLFSTVRPYLKNIAIVTNEYKDCIASTGFYICRSKGALINKYLYYLLCSEGSINYFTSMMKGDNSPSIRKEEFECLNVLLPPLKEQERIVDRIESLFEKLDKAKGLIEEAREGFEKRKKIILRDAFVGKLTRNYRSKNDFKSNVNNLIKDIRNELEQWYQEKCITAKLEGNKKPRKLNFDIQKSEFEYLFKDIPLTWRVSYFQEIIAPVDNSLKAGPFGSSLKKSMYVKKGYKIYGQEQVISGNINYGDYYINEEKFNELRSCEVREGDLLISLVGTIGKTLIIPKEYEKGIINPRLLKISINKKISVEYIKMYFESPIAKYIMSEKSHGGTMEILNLDIIKKLPIPIPPIEEQKEIVRILDKLLQDESKFEQLTVLEDQIELIKKSTLAKAFRGELGTNDSNEESALELLKEILSKE